MAKSKVVEVNKRIENKVVGGYKSIERSIVGGFNKITDKFVDNYLTKDGETVEEAKDRLKVEEINRKDKSILEMDTRKQHIQELTK